MTLEEMLALLPDNTTGAIDAADLRAIVIELYNDANTFAQVFGYLWQSSGLNPPAGKVGVTPVWSLTSDTLRISETTDDGHNLVFTLLDTSSARVILAGAGGGVLRADITGVSTDQGSYREIPITVTAVDGIVPINGEKVSVTILAQLP